MYGKIELIHYDYRITTIKYQFDNGWVDKPSVQVESAQDLVKALSAIKSAVEAGELDSQIEEASNTLRKGFGK